MLEQVGVAAGEGRRGEVDEAFVRDALAQRMRRFDKGGDQFYDQISALHKSVRGSNPDASLYWLTRMLDGGADPLYIARRLVRMAIEDIGLADPRALRMRSTPARLTSGWDRRRASSRSPRRRSTWRSRPRATLPIPPSAPRANSFSRTSPAPCPSICATRPRSS
jgi:hypothetical protein